MDCQRMVLLRCFKFLVGLLMFLELLSTQGGYGVIGFHCTKYESYTKSTYVPYTETYRTRNWAGFWKIMTRSNWRWEYHPALRTVTTCCDGFKSASSECIPVCPSGCSNGVCYQPNVCNCFSGYVPRLNMHSAWMDCVPHCPDGCYDGKCTSPGTCTCSAGYQFSKDLRSCVPSCLSVGAGGSLGCGANASCIAPDKCQCHDGYEKNPKDAPPLCLPKCTPTCGMNAFCESPGKCICSAGYQFSKDLRSCVPSCLSVGGGGSLGCGENASCIAPDKCQCHDGYEKNPRDTPPLCLPICTPTCGMNAFCESPGKCICNTGYVIDRNPLLAFGAPPTDDGTTTTDRLFTTVGTTVNVPSTHCKPSCVPECAKNSICVAPNECQCAAGYRSVSSSSETDHSPRCDPICERTCVNAFCGYPNGCVCHFGYQPHPVEKSVCVPICRDDCVNAQCVRPDHCECNDGYVKKDNYDGHRESNSTNVCIPNCPGGCPNGKCVAPGKCACNPGYVLSSLETTLDFSTTTDSITTGSELSGYYSTEYTDYSRTDHTDYYSTGNTDHYSTDSTNYYGTDDTSDSSTTTIAPISQQICQPLCEPECPSGSTCIAPPDHCQSQSGINEDSNDSVTDRRPMKNDSNICDGNGNGNGSSCGSMESAIVSHTTASAIGTLALLAAVSGLGTGVYLTLRKRKNVASQALATNTIGTMERLLASDPLISTDVSYP